MTNKLISFLRKPLGNRSHFRRFRAARVWSNRELRKFSHLFTGSIINVSAWEDKDKEGCQYKDYFSSASSYYITNYGTDQGVIQGSENEYFLDLESPTPDDLREKFDVVFNHTVLEHVYDFHAAISNLCNLSSDIVIVVVPWMQELHATYGDYWRFSPQAVTRLFEDNGFSTLHLSWSEIPRASVYILAIASRHPERWVGKLGNPVDTSSENFLIPPANLAGKHAF